jgi:hypothetical protein
MLKKKKIKHKIHSMSKPTSSDLTGCYLKTEIKIQKIMLQNFSNMCRAAEPLSTQKQNQLNLNLSRQLTLKVEFKIKTQIFS